MIGIIGTVLQLLVPLFQWYFQNKAQTEQNTQDYIDFIQIMSRLELISVERRMKALDGIERAKQLWEKQNGP